MQVGGRDMNQAQGAQLQTDLAQAALCDALRQGILRDGQFVSMPQLVDLIGYPLAAVREAVKYASAQGLLTTVPKRGVQVMEARPETIRACLDFRMVLDQEGARRRIAKGALSGLDDLRQQHQDMLAAAGASDSDAQPPRAIAVDLSLHDYLSEGLENEQLARVYGANRMRIAIIQNARPFLQVRIVSAMEEHLAIIDALEQGDAEAAVQAISDHCAQTLRWWGVA